jgi:hypothetical protein
MEFQTIKTSLKSVVVYDNVVREHVIAKLKDVAEITSCYMTHTLQFMKL